jgi:flagellar biogenesis protein FliO
MPALWLLQAVTPTREVTSLASYTYDYLKLILVFGLVLVFVILVLRVWLPRMTGMRQLSSGPIRVVARYPLEPRKNLYVVQAAGSYFLVGTSDSGVHYLTTLDPSALESSLTAETPAAPLDFAKLMHSFKRSGRGS